MAIPSDEDTGNEEMNMFVSPISRDTPKITKQAQDAVNKCRDELDLLIEARDACDVKGLMRHYAAFMSWAGSAYRKIDKSLEIMHDTGDDKYFTHNLDNSLDELTTTADNVIQNINRHCKCVSRFE